MRHLVIIPAVGGMNNTPYSIMSPFCLGGGIYIIGGVSRGMPNIYGNRGDAELPLGGALINLLSNNVVKKATQKG